MTEQDIATLWPQIRTELAVFLGRPTVQLQLIVVVAMMVIAAVLGRIARRRWVTRFGLLEEEATLWRRLTHHIFIQVVATVFAIILIMVAGMIMSLSGARTALIDSLLQIVFLYLGLRLLVAIAYAVGDHAGIERYRRTLILPLFTVIVAIQALSLFFPGDRLGEAPVFVIFDNTVTLAALFLITAGFYLWIVGVHALGQGVHHVATSYGGADDGSTQATLTLLRYILIIVGLGYVLFRLNFNTTTIAAISGGLSVGIGFALSTILSNFVSGILLLFERTLHPGDIIDYNGIFCTVEKITIRSIRVRTFDNVEMVIPNSDFVTAPFTTYTGDSQQIRLKIPVGTSYDDDHRLVIDTLMEVAEKNPHIMSDPAPDVRLENFGDFSLDYQMYVWIATPMVMAIARNQLHQSILDAFEEKGINIPFPTAIEIQRTEK